MLCPGSPNSRLSSAIEEDRTSSNLERFNGHALDKSCPIPIITITLVLKITSVVLGSYVCPILTVNAHLV